MPDNSDGSKGLAGPYVRVNLIGWNIYEWMLLILYCKWSEEK